MRWKITQDLKSFSHSKWCKKYWEKIHFVQESGENIPKRRKFYRHRGVYKNSQFVKCANVTIPAKGPAYLRRVSSGYVERSPLHFVLWFELFSSSKHMASNWLGCMYGVRRREMAPSLAALWLGRKIQRFSGTNQKQLSEARTSRTIWNWSFKTLSPGDLLPVLDFFSREFFSRPF